MPPLVIVAVIGEITLGVVLGLFAARGDRWRVAAAALVLGVAGLALAGVGGLARDQLSVDQLLWLQGAVAASFLSCAVVYRATTWWRGRDGREARAPFDFS